MLSLQETFLRRNEQVKIDDEFSSLIPALTEDEYKRLEASILNEGCRDAIVLW